MPRLENAFFLTNISFGWFWLGLELVLVGFHSGVFLRLVCWLRKALPLYHERSL